MTDVERIRADFGTGRRLVIIGGLHGLEVASDRARVGLRRPRMLEMAGSES